MKNQSTGPVIFYDQRDQKRKLIASICLEKEIPNPKGGPKMLAYFKAESLAYYLKWIKKKLKVLITSNVHFIPFDVFSHSFGDQYSICISKTKLYVLIFQRLALRKFIMMNIFIYRINLSCKLDFPIILFENEEEVL